MRKIKVILVIISWLCAHFACVSAESVSSLAKSARTHLANGDYPEASACYGKITDMLSDPGMLLYRIPYLRAYTDVLLSMGDYDKVEKLLADTLYDSDVILQINRAASAGYRGDNAAALEILDRCAENGTGDKTLDAKILQNKGFICLEIKDYDRAETNFREAAPHLNGPELDILNSNLALCLAYKGDYDRAVELILASADNLKKQGKAWHRDYTRCLRKYAEILMLAGRKTEANSAFRNYFNLEREWLCAQLPDLTANGRLSLWLSERPLISKCFVTEDLDADFMYEAAMFRRLTSILGINDVEKLQKLLKLNTRAVRNSLRRGEAAVETICYTDMEDRDIYAAVILPKTGKPVFVRLFEEDKLHSRTSNGGVSVINAIRSNSREDKNRLYSDTELADMVWQPILKALPKGTDKIYFAPEGIFHFWGIENMPFEGRDNYELHRVTSTAFLTDRKAAGAGTQDKGAGANTLLVGGLDYYKVPEEKAAGPASHEAADILKERTGRNNVFGYLPGTRSEVDSIKAIRKTSEISYSLGETELKKKMPSYSTVHIATHGYSLDMGIRKRPEFLADSAAYDRSLSACGLALTGANILNTFDGMDDGLLSAREICDLDLSNVDFVILSACQTAQGDITDEGAAGLVRGLKNAGAKTILATLWPVDDMSTMQFMQAFYRNLDAGMEKRAAFDKARDFLKEFTERKEYRGFSPATLARAKEAKTRTLSYEEPVYWAPFILIDDF